MKKLLLGASLAALLTACGSGGNSPSATEIKIVGSSTVYPFTTAVAESFERANPGVRVFVESTGTGSGMKLFCEGLGTQYPDMVNASRRMKSSEFENCEAAGVTEILELPIGIDGLTLIHAAGDAPLTLTSEQVYRALAATPYGDEQTATRWSDIDPSLPDTPILVYGPPPTSGTRDSFVELVMEVGCDANAEMQALKDSDEDAHKTTCTKIREDGAFVEAGENDNLLVQKVSGEPGALGILGYSFLDANADKVRPVALDGVEPTPETISSLEYPAARLLYVYAKKQHAAAKPALADFIAAYKDAWQPGGLLATRGLVALGDEQRASSDAVASEMTVLDGSSL
ncbi:substrate-binding domain-containing protein [Sphingomicrobium astaxanthinifaciens]|uniref:substrate-binding domain-containing protein n=1 Tax=Sphingomicrobium astaxanthinifaciens TaxID=1227949 RepID=UPI001FCA58A2|nr:substrate-binding domain-containing protein [Sphingomicrobium astaxanthinifaciens]MCJ7421562.1 substrate-binding domain-containing protein [Sphingomicrobium astaxanthinifaciens]